MRIGQASIDERGKATGGQAGDQTGKEIKIGNWYKYGNGGWNVVIRAKDRTKAHNMAQAMIAACNNNKIGYDQNQRESCLTEVKKVGNDFAKIATPTETDCSALVATIIVATGTNEAKMRNPARKNALAYTGDLEQLCRNTGEFEFLKDSKYLNSGDYLLEGDIILNTQHHVVMAIENGSKANVTPVDTKGAEKFVDNLYTNALGRPADDAGKQNWVNQLVAQKTGGANVAQGIVFSQECINRKLDNDAWITMLYLAVLGRPADEPGKKDWLNKLNVGTSREEVFYNFTITTEFANYCKSCGILIGSVAAPKKTESKPAETKPTTTNKVKVTSKNGLNVRKGPSTSYPLAQSPLAYGAIVAILDEKNGWGKIGTDKWIMLKYTTKI